MQFKKIKFLAILSLSLFIPLCLISSNNIHALNAKNININVDQDNLLDVVLSLGHTDSDVSTLEKDLKDALIAKGVPENKMKIQAVESSEVSAGNTTSGWETYDHTNHNDSSVISYYRPFYQEQMGNYTLNQHIVPLVDGTSTDIDFFGYGSPAYKDFMYMPNNDSGKKTFEFTIQEGEFYDALNGAGFLFNTKMSSNSDLANRTMSGYMIFFRYQWSSPPPIVEIYKFTNVNVNTFHNEAYTEISENYPGFTKIASYQADSSTSRGVKIEATADSLKMWYNTNLVNWNLAAGGMSSDVSLDTDFGSYGFGPIVGYLSHGCNRHTHFTFYDVSMKTESSKRFSEVIREPEWREGSKRFVINAEDGAVADFSDPVALGEILSRLGNENIHYLGWGRNEADAQSFIDKTNGNGIFIDKDAVSTDTYSKQIAALANYIYSKYVDGVVNDTEYLIYGYPNTLSITPDSEKNNTADENWPDGKWKVKHDENYFENSTGVVPYDGLYLSNLDITFTETGKYVVYYKDEAVKTIYVHRKPVAAFNVKLDGSLNTTFTDNSYDPDFKSAPDKGIASVNWAYKETTASSWTSGKPSKLVVDKNYIIKQVVIDGYGVESKPYYRYVSTETTGGASTPIADFEISTQKLLTYNGQTISYTNSSYDPKGDDIVDQLWKIDKNGSEIYSGSAPKTDFTGIAAGNYRITLSVKNESGKWSETAARYLTIVRDDTKPTVTCDTDNGTYDGTKLVTLNFSDEVGGSGFNYRYVQVTNSATPPTEWGSMGTNVVYKVLLNKVGDNYIHCKFYDNAGNENIVTFGPIVLKDNKGPSEPNIATSPLYTDGTWSNKITTVSASGSTDDFTAAENIKYEVSKDGVTYTSGDSIKLEKSGTYTVYFKVTDESNNSTIVSKIVKVDLDAPGQPYISMISGAKTYIGGSWTNKNVVVTLSGSVDIGGSELKGYQYKIDNGKWIDGATDTFTKSGIYTFSYRAIDNAGNTSASKSKTIKVDLEGPKAFIITTSVDTIDSIHINASTTDVLSGMATNAYRVYDGNSWSEWKSSVDELLTGYDRNEKVSIKVEAKDLAGNVTTSQISATTLGNTVPNISGDKFVIDENSGEITLDVLKNDKDADNGDKLTVTSVSELSDTKAGTLTLVNGVITFIPAEGYSGKVSFTYTAADAFGGTSTGVAEINVNSVAKVVSDIVNSSGSHEEFFSWICVVGWIVAIILLTANYIKNRVYYNEKVWRIILYVLASLLVLTLLCFLKLYFGYIFSIVVMLVYVLTNYLYADWASKDIINKRNRHINK